MEALEGWIVPLIAGIVLAAVAGLRSFLPLFVVGLAGRLDWLELGEGFGWLERPAALVALGAACLLEMLGDKVPAVDHALDAVGLALRPLAGAVVALSVLGGVDPLWTMVLALAAGGATAGAVQVAKAKTRLGSSLLSLGALNPLLSLLEDLLAIAGALLAVLLPLLALAFLLVLAATLWLAWRLSGRLLRGPRPGAAMASARP